MLLTNCKDSLEEKWFCASHLNEETPKWVILFIQNSHLYYNLHAFSL